MSKLKRGNSQKWSTCIESKPMGPVHLKPVRPSGKLPLIAALAASNAELQHAIAGLKQHQVSALKNCMEVHRSACNCNLLSNCILNCCQLAVLIWKVWLATAPIPCAEVRRKELAKQPQWCLVSLDHGSCFFYHVQTTHRFSCPCTNAPKSRSAVRASCLIQECGHNLISCFTPSMKPRCPDWWLPLIGVTIKVAIAMTDFLWHWQCCNYQQMHIM